MVSTTTNTTFDTLCARKTCKTIIPIIRADFLAFVDIEVFVMEMVGKHLCLERASSFTSKETFLLPKMHIGLDKSIITICMHQQTCRNAAGKESFMDNPLRHRRSYYLLTACMLACLLLLLSACEQGATLTAVQQKVARTPTLWTLEPTDTSIPTPDPTDITLSYTLSQFTEHI